LLKSFPLKLSLLKTLPVSIQGSKPCQLHDECWGFGNWQHLPLARCGLIFYIGLIMES
jgi:hypothetical protein